MQLNNSISLNSSLNSQFLIKNGSKKMSLANKKDNPPCAPAGANCPNPSGPVLYRPEDFLPVPVI